MTEHITSLIICTHWSPCVCCSCSAKRAKKVVFLPSRRSPRISLHDIFQKWVIKRRNWLITLKVWTRHGRDLPMDVKLKWHPNGHRKGRGAGNWTHGHFWEAAHAQLRACGEHKLDINEAEKTKRRKMCQSDWRWPKTRLNGILKRTLRLENLKTWKPKEWKNKIISA